MCGTQTNLVRREEWVSCVVLICFTFLCIRSNALPARPLPVVSGKPHGAITYLGAQISSDSYSLDTCSGAQLSSDSYSLDTYSGAQLSSDSYSLDSYCGAQLSLDIRDRSNFNDSTVHCVMLTPNATATNIGGRPRPTISSFPSLLLTPSDFNSRSTASSGAPFRVNSTTTTSIYSYLSRSE